MLLTDNIYKGSCGCDNADDNGLMMMMKVIISFI